ncbi:hypothetical protein FVB32_01020 [Flagellimonas hymeniacidonis]|uniref:Uncharacterized protein n=1 Tax=Flagellimonas hymeniacidonis TaxID=2603628 RepID=A0A5C8V6Y1_9FLAO|nr:hypothetical protein [Flagellimonas hymeniacidonis]TXN36899.1 hypothetical protein FVB32_01020 [Flagellimonas hymeniacidonis]
MKGTIDSIQIVFKETIESIREYCTRWYSAEKDMVFRKLKYKDLSETNPLKFFHLNNIKKDNGLNTWNSKYLNESLNDIYVRNVARVVIDELEYFEEYLFDFQVGQNLDALKEKIVAKEEEILKLKNEYRVYGIAIAKYLKTENEGSDGLMFERFKIIKELNTEYGNNNQCSSTHDYPYFEVNGVEFLDFELIYVFCKLFFKLSKILPSNTQDLRRVNENYYSSIFAHEVAEEILSCVLKHFKAIDNVEIAVKGRFMPITDAFWSVFQEDLDFFRKSAKKIEYIKYLDTTYGLGTKAKLSGGVAHEKEVSDFVENLSTYKTLKG